MHKLCEESSTTPTWLSVMVAQVLATLRAWACRGTTSTLVVRPTASEVTGLTDVRMISPRRPARCGFSKRRPAHAKTDVEESGRRGYNPESEARI